MFRHIIFVILLLSFMFVSCQAQKDAELGVALQWQLKSGETGEKVFPSTALSTLDGKGLWVAFKKDGEKSYPGIVVGGKFFPADVPLQDIAALRRGHPGVVHQHIDPTESIQRSSDNLLMKVKSRDIAGRGGEGRQGDGEAQNRHQQCEQTFAQHILPSLLLWRRCA